MENHIKSHNKINPFKCDTCDKEFFVKWRLEKHTQGHRETRKYCHYYNNDKYCPYDEIGCKYKHEDSNKCKFDKSCRFKLCQFKHSTQGQDVLNEKDEKHSETNDAEHSDDNSYEDTDSEDYSLTDDENSDYVQVTESELKENDYKDCGCCGKKFNVQNTYKCKKCGIASHRSNCNTNFEHIKKHYFCGGCVYDFKFTQ